MLKTTLIPFALSLLFIAGCTQKQNTLSSSEKAEGFVLLFDGQSLQGWRAYMEDPMEAAWSVQDGALVLKGGSEKGSYANIVTTGEYDDFDLRFEWKIEPGSNTGLMFHVKEGPKMPYLTGPEYQLLDDEGFRGGDGKPVPPEEYTASHYAIEAAYQEVTKPVGEWNTSRILVVGNVVQYWLNEVKTADYEMHSEKWNKQVADAKFGNWKTFGTTETGHLALQDHGHGAWFRNIKIKELSKH